MDHREEVVSTSGKKKKEVMHIFQKECCVLTIISFDMFATFLTQYILHVSH